MKKEKTLVDITSSLCIEEILPRHKKTGIPFPEPSWIAGMVRAKFRGEVEHRIIRKMLDNWFGVH